MNETHISPDEAAILILGELLAIKPGENIAIVSDQDSSTDMIQALQKRAQSMGVECTIVEQYSRTPERKNELSKVAEAAIAGADVVIGITGSGGAPSYSAVVKECLQAKKIRVMSMVMRDLEIFTSGGALADYEQLLVDGKTLANLWNKTSVIRISTPSGTDIKAPIANDYAIIECGYAREPGESAAFTDGEVSSRPIEGTAEGIIVVDGPIAVIGKPDSPITIEVSGGLITTVNGNCKQAGQLRDIVENVPNARNIAEFGLGLNPACRRNGRFQEEKKARGLVHIALGDNIYYGGTINCRVHMDMVLYEPTVMFDENEVVSHGQLRI